MNRRFDVTQVKDPQAQRLFRDVLDEFRRLHDRIGQLATAIAALSVGGGGGAPSAHATTHQNGGTDEINVAGLSGVLADPQTPAAHGHAQSDVTNLVTDLAARFTLVGLQAFTTTGANVYTPTAGMKFALAISTGAGGGGGGADCTGAADAAAGAGGGAGGTCIELFNAATIGASQTVTIGTGGTAGTNAGGNGGNGGNTTFGALHTANGGTGGAGAATGTANVRTTAGGAGGVPTGGLANITGGDGCNGVALLTPDATDTNEVAFAAGGNGGAGMWGGGGRGGQNAQDAGAADSTAGSQAGVNGAAFGSGGGGGAVLNTATGVTGGTGANGFCLVLEFG